jgi:hypothetical protein
LRKVGILQELLQPESNGWHENVRLRCDFRILAGSVGAAHRLAYVKMFPEGGDSWDAKYFFTHPAFFIFAAGFTIGISWKIIRSRQISN